MPDLIPELTRSQTSFAAHLADSLAVGNRVCLSGASGSGKSTILRAAAGQLSATSGRPIAVLDAQSNDRLAWGIVRHTSGRCQKPRELTTEGTVLFLDDGDCHVRIRDEDPLAIVGDYAADVRLAIPAWTFDEMELATPSVATMFANADASVRTPRHLRLAEAMLQLGLSTEQPLTNVRTDRLVARLLAAIEARSPLSIDLLFAASELGTLPLATEWFVNWRGLTRSEVDQATHQLFDSGLIDPHGPGEWTAPAIVRVAIRQQMSVPYRRAAAQGLARRLLRLADHEPLAVLPHLTTLWKRLQTSSPELSAELWQCIAPQWTAYGFRFRNEDADESSTNHSPAAEVAKMLVQARQFRQRGAVLEAEHKLAKAVRVAEATLPEDNDTRLDARIEYAAVRLTGHQRLAAMAELRDLLGDPAVQSELKRRQRIENDLASALFYDGQFDVAARAFENLAISLGPSPMAARALNNAGECFRASGDLAAAVRTLSQSIDMSQGLGLAETPPALSAQMNLGGVYADTGRYVEAVDHFRTVVQTREQTFSPNAAPLVTARLMLAECLCAIEHFPEAEQLLNSLPGDGRQPRWTVAEEVLRAMIDRHANRVVKAELRLLRVADADDLTPALRCRAACELAETYLAEHSLPEAAKWVRVAVEAVRPIETLLPAVAFRTFITATQIEVAAERWDGVANYLTLARAVMIADDPNATRYQTFLDAMEFLASRPGEETWSTGAEAITAWLDSSTVETTTLPLTRIVEHAAAADQTAAAALWLDPFVTQESSPRRDWLVLRASLAVLNDEPNSAGWWKRVVLETPSRDEDEQRTAEAVLKAVNNEDAVDAGSQLIGEWLSGRFRDTDLREIPAEDEDATADELPDDSVLNEPAGHVLDELF